MTDSLTERASLAAMRAYGLGENEIGNVLAACRESLLAADKLAHETERRMNDLGGYDRRFPVRQALEDFRTMQLKWSSG